MPGIMFNQREIVLVPFPYSNLNFTKKRPVLIVSNNLYNSVFSDVWVCVITSNNFIDECSEKLENEDLEMGTLPERSVIKTHKLFTIDKIKIIKKFGIVKYEYYDKIKNKIELLIQNSKK